MAGEGDLNLNFSLKKKFSSKVKQFYNETIHDILRLDIMKQMSRNNELLEKKNYYFF